MQPVGQQTVGVMNGKPDWLAWTYAGKSISGAFEGEQQAWQKTVDWIICGPHLTNNQKGTRGYGAVRLWMVAVGLLYRDLMTMTHLPTPPQISDQRLLKGMREMTLTRQLNL